MLVVYVLSMNNLFDFFLDNLIDLLDAAVARVNSAEISVCKGLSIQNTRITQKNTYSRTN